FLPESPEPVTAQVMKTALANIAVSPKALVTATGARHRASLAPERGKAPRRTGAPKNERRRTAGGAARRVSACQLERAGQGRARHARRGRRRIHWRGSPVGYRAAVPTATLLALLNACVIAAYTTIDGLGVRASRAPVAYSLWLSLLVGLPWLVWVAMRRDYRWADVRRQLPAVALGGACSVGSYTLALWA